MKPIFKYFAIILGLTVSASAWGQAREISGKVTNASNGEELPGVQVAVKGHAVGTTTDSNGEYAIKVPASAKSLIFSFVGFENEEVHIKNQSVIDVALKESVQELQEMVVDDEMAERKMSRSPRFMVPAGNASMEMDAGYSFSIEHNTESYAPVEETGFRSPAHQPLSTFSADVDAASYSNMRRFINDGYLPPRDAVRVEEMINYFDYGYEEPEGRHPFAVHLEQSDCPWAPGHRLVKIGVQGKKMEQEVLPPSNLVFLLDVSGSMDSPDKLPLLKSAMRLLISRLRPEDRVAIVVYAGAAGEVLPSTPGDEKAAILKALDRLSAGGSTAGGEGIMLAYDVAQKHFIKEGNNRVIIATDGDFNVGASSNAAMQRLIEEKRETGVFLTVLGFGTGNYKDDRMEILADKGNGNYAYIDNLMEAKKVLVSEMSGTLVTIAKDVKFQVEFNPQYVSGYRLIGYENRRLNDEDFNDDKKDAGEIGAGHNVTAIYEIVPAGMDPDVVKPVDDLKYQKTVPGPASNEWLTVKVRYKKPDGDNSILIEIPMKGEENKFEKMGADYQWAVAVAEAGLLLSQSEHAGNASFSHVLSTARSVRGHDENGYRTEFIQLMELAESLHEAQLEAKK